MSKGFKGRENVYTCQDCGRHTTTIDRDAGVTPFMIGCPFCDGDAYSAFYPKGPRPAHVPPPTHEWYRPSLWQRLWLDRAMREHVRLGGLVLREIRR